MMNRMFLLVAAGSLVLTSWSAAPAFFSPGLTGQVLVGRPDSRCRDYARVLVRQNEANRRYRCGYPGPGWSSDYKYHYAWCRRRRASQARLNRIIRMRWAALADCRRSRPPVGTGGFNNPRWRGNLLDWCLGSGRGCGRVTADAFCRSHGYRRASAFNGPRVTPDRTSRMATGQSCKTKTCQSFYFIHCVK